MKEGAVLVGRSCHRHGSGQTLGGWEERKESQCMRYGVAERQVGGWGVAKVLQDRPRMFL